MRVITTFALVVLGVALGHAQDIGEGPFCHQREHQLECYRFHESELKLWNTSQLSVSCENKSDVVSITPGTTIFNNLTDLTVQDCDAPTIIMDLDQSSVSHDFLEKIVLFNLEISILPPGVFTKFTRLTNLDLSGNKITIVRASTFPTSLEDLFLITNLIETIEVDAFNELKDLKTLRLSENNLTVIHPGTFSQLTDLEILNLSYNKLTAILPDTFNQLTDLTFLYLLNNKLQTLSGFIFNGLTNLTDLYLMDNEINEIAADTFKQLPNLERLELTNNKLTSLPERLFSENKRLWRLYLDGNKITHIYGNTFKGPTRIQMFEMDAKPVVYVASNAFTNFKNRDQGIYNKTMLAEESVY